MKKIITLLLLVFAIVAVSNNADVYAKSTKGKKTSTTKSSGMKFDEEGYPIITGHTYSINDGYVKMSFAFYDDYVQVKGSEGGKSVLNEKLSYTADGDTFAIYDPAVPNTPMFDGQINFDGKYLILSSGFAMKLVR